MCPRCESICHGLTLCKHDPPPHVDRGIAGDPPDPSEDVGVNIFTQKLDPAHLRALRGRVEAVICCRTSRLPTHLERVYFVFYLGLRPGASASEVRPPAFMSSRPSTFSVCALPCSPPQCLPCQVSSAHVFTPQLRVSAACRYNSAPSHAIIAALTVHISFFPQLLLLSLGEVLFQSAALTQIFLRASINIRHTCERNV